jgi:hypothetical protein
VIYESRLELARLLYADFDPSVRRVVAQPFLLTAKVSGVERKHVPDDSLLTDSWPVVVDVKPASTLIKPKVACTLTWTRSAIQARRWIYEVWAEPPTAGCETYVDVLDGLGSWGGAAGTGGRRSDR